MKRNRRKKEPQKITPPLDTPVGSGF